MPDEYRISENKLKHAKTYSLFQCQYDIYKRKSIYCMMKSTCAEPRKECVRARLAMYHPFLCTRSRVPVNVSKRIAPIIERDYILMHLLLLG